jgi:transposase
MTYSFLRGDRDQPFLLPPDLRDWLPQGHLAWFVLDVVDQLDLAPFYLAYRDDGHGHPAYDPKLLLGVLLYAYCLGVRSSRQLERRLTEDIAFRVLAANQTPDHVTIARFRARHQHALAGFLVASLKLCAAAGMVQVGTVALDGTKLAGNAADKANRTHDQLQAEVAEILRQAAEADQREDQLFGDAQGGELPEALASKAGRLARLRQAKAQLEAEAAAREQAYQQRVAAHAAAAAAKGTTPRTLKRRPQEIPNPDASANVTDPDSRFLHTRRGTVQGYNAQAVTTGGRPSNRSSARSKSSRAPAASCAGACAPARRSGSCCAAPTTCSSCGDTRSRRKRPRRRSPERPRGAVPEAAAPPSTSHLDGRTRLLSARRPSVTCLRLL